MEELKKIAEDIRKVLDKKREELRLSFVEDKHIYYILDLNGKITSKYPSVTKILKNFYEPFDANAKSLQMAKGDVEKQKKLLNEWKTAGDLSTNMGSRVHFELEKYLVDNYDNFKEVRQPLFECEDDRIIKSDAMILGGKKYLKIMEERGAIPLDTEIVLGDNKEGYVGQGDNCWLMHTKDKTEFGFLFTDWKTNQPKNFESQWYTKKMYPPFNKYPDTALSHYYIQIPLYGRLLKSMLKGTRYENIRFFGGVIVLLKDDGTYVEYKVPREIKDNIMTMDLKKYLKK